MNALARLILKHRRLILTGWLLSLLLCLGYLTLFPQDASELEIRGARYTDAAQVEEILEKAFTVKPELAAAIVIKGTANAETMRQRILAAYPQVARLEKMPAKGDHQTQLFYLEFHPETLLGDSQALIRQMRHTLRQWAGEHGVQVYVTGAAGFFLDMKEAGQKDTSQNEKMALLLAFVILLFNFGSLTAALLPVMMGGTTLIYANTLVKAANLEIEPLSQVLSSMIGLALAIDYSLFLVSRFKEEKRRQGTAGALVVALKYAGKTILFSALIMICSISVLLIPDVSSSMVVVQSILVVIGFSLINSLLVLPALLAWEGDWLEFPRFLARRIDRLDTYPQWKRFSVHIVRYPGAYFLLSLALIAGLTAPVLSIKLWEPMQTLTPPRSESRQAYDLLRQDGWGGELIPITLVVKAPAGQTVFDPAAVAYIYNLSRAIESHPDVGSVISLAAWKPDYQKQDYLFLYNSLQTMRTLGMEEPPILKRLVNTTQDSRLTLVSVHPRHLMDLARTHGIIGFIQQYAREHPGYQVLVGGLAARSRDFTHEMYRHMPLMLGLILLSIFALLFYYMKALVLPIKAAMMNFLPIFCAYGILTAIFQYGFLSPLLHTPHNGAVSSMVPIILFCVIFGLSMDYEVLILSRITEEYEKCGEVKTAVTEGLARSGSVITGAALILLGVFIPGIFSTSPLVQELSIGITAAIFIDATVLRLLLVPSFMCLMGRWNWWNPFRKTG